MYCTLNYTHNFFYFDIAHFQILVAIITLFAMHLPLLRTDKVSVTIFIILQNRNFIKLFDVRI